MVGCQTGKATTRMVPSCSAHPGEVGGKDVWGWVGGWWARNCSGAVSRAREPPPRAPPPPSAMMVCSAPNYGQAWKGFPSPSPPANCTECTPLLPCVCGQADEQQVAHLQGTLAAGVGHPSPLEHLHSQPLPPSAPVLCFAER